MYKVSLHEFSHTLFMSPLYALCADDCNIYIAAYLRLGDAKASGKFRPLGQGQVLGPLKPALQLLYLQAGVDAARLADFLPLPVHSGDQFTVLHYAV